jgi:hypothetical protein
MVDPFRIREGVTALLIAVSFVHTMGWFGWMFGFEGKKIRRRIG